MTAFQRATTMANFMPAAERSPSTATGLPLTGSVQAQKLNGNPGSGSTVKMRDFQCVSVMGERRATACVAGLRAKPRFRGLMNGIKRGDFDQDIGGRRKLAIDKFEIAQRGQKSGASTRRGPQRQVFVVGVAVLLLPSLAQSEAQSGKETCKPVISLRAASGT